MLLAMARALRVEYPGAFYHIINRGNAGDDIFKSLIFTKIPSAPTWQQSLARIPSAVIRFLTFV